MCVGGPFPVGPRISTFHRGGIKSQWWQPLETTAWSQGMCLAPYLDSAAWLMLHCHPAVSFPPRSCVWSVGLRCARGALSRVAVGANNAVLGTASMVVATPPNTISAVCPVTGDSLSEAGGPWETVCKIVSPLIPKPLTWSVTQPLLHPGKQLISQFGS